MQELLSLVDARQSVRVLRDSFRAAPCLATGLAASNPASLSLHNLMHCHLIVLEFVAPTGHNKKNTHKKNQVFRIFFFFQGVFLILSGPTIPATDAWMWVSLVGSLVFETVCVKSPTSMRLSVDAPQLLFCKLAFGFHLPLCILLNPGWLLLCLHLLSHV